MAAPRSSLCCSWRCRRTRRIIPTPASSRARAADVSPEDAQLACAYSFFRQKPDGTFVGYEIDKLAFLTDGTLRYERYGEGNCTIDADRVEVCTTTASSDKDEIGASYFDVMTVIDADTVGSQFFETRAAATAYATRAQGRPSFESHFVRCNGFDETVLGDALTDKMTTLSTDDQGPLQSPEFDEASRATMRAILTKLGTQP
ncbi:MAG: hypothetical protein WDM94_02000 [Bauldia sp.]